MLELPRRLKALFLEFGFEASHTLDLPRGNRTKDIEIVQISENENRIVVTKDNDFIESYLLYHKPEKLLFLSCGNMSNPDFENLIRTNLLRIAREFEFNNFIELNREDIVVHS
jgi:predicted nuclease of predicted toxin-antitoxin system